MVLLPHIPVRTIPLIFWSFLLFHLVISGITYFQYECIDIGNYTRSSVFQTNLNRVLPNLSSIAAQTGFHNSTLGQTVDTVYALFLCRGDVPHKVCEDCVSAAAQKVVEGCPVQKEAIIWYEECMLRYSNRSIFSLLEVEPRYYSNASNQVSSVSYFSQVLSNTMDSIIHKAAYNSPTPTFATEEANYTLFSKLYNLVQCTPDITADECNRCLRVAIDTYQRRLSGSVWGKVYTPSCQLRYDIAPFYSVETPPTQPTATTTESGKHMTVVSTWPDRLVNFHRKGNTEIEKKKKYSNNNGGFILIFSKKATAPHKEVHTLFAPPCLRFECYTTPFPSPFPS